MLRFGDTFAVSALKLFSSVALPVPSTPAPASSSVSLPAPVVSPTPSSVALPAPFYAPPTSSSSFDCPPPELASTVA